MNPRIVTRPSFSITFLAAIVCWLACDFMARPSAAAAETYQLLGAGRESVIGEIRKVRPNREDTLIDVARRFDIGQDEMTIANPGANRWVPDATTEVTIPSLFIVPAVPREGIVINIAELRLYYFPKFTGFGGEERPSATQPVTTYPISIGRMDWRTPMGKTTVIAKEEDPAWRPTESIRAEHAAEGDVLPAVIPGGTPENPLGRFALRLGVPGYLIHGTDERKSLGIGMRVTHGCMRMYPEDIEQLFRQVDVKTPVLIIDQPVKIGWRGPTLHVEIHGPAPDDDPEVQSLVPVPAVEEVVQLLTTEAAGELELDIAAITRAVQEHSGIPVPVGTTKSSLPPARR